MVIADLKKPPVERLQTNFLYFENSVSHCYTGFLQALQQFYNESEIFTTSHLKLPTQKSRPFSNK